MAGCPAGVSVCVACVAAVAACDDDGGGDPVAVETVPQATVHADHRGRQRRGRRAAHRAAAARVRRRRRRSASRSSTPRSSRPKRSTPPAACSGSRSSSSPTSTRATTRPRARDAIAGADRGRRRRGRRAGVVDDRPGDARRPAVGGHPHLLADGDGAGARRLPRLRAVHPHRAERLAAGRRARPARRATPAPDRSPSPTSTTRTAAARRGDDRRPPLARARRSTSSCRSPPRTTSLLVDEATMISSSDVDVVIVLGDGEHGARMLSEIGEATGITPGERPPDIFVNDAIRRPPSPQLIQALATEVRERITGVSPLAYGTEEGEPAGAVRHQRRRLRQPDRPRRGRRRERRRRGHARPRSSTSATAASTAGRSPSAPQLIDDCNIDYDGPGGAVQLGAEGDPARRSVRPLRLRRERLRRVQTVAVAGSTDRRELTAGGTIAKPTWVSAT